MATFDFPRTPGSYVLELYLADGREIQVGRLGVAYFPVGWYLYAGSALNGLSPRIERHIRVEKSRHWHVDALREYADLASIYVIQSRDRLECTVAASIASLDGSFQPLARFGASDCHCPTHLLGFTQRPMLDLGPGWSHVSLPLVNTSVNEC
jgi:sugar fermentation stimulation protein A